VKVCRYAGFIFPALASWWESPATPAKGYDVARQALPDRVITICSEAVFPALFADQYQQWMSGSMQTLTAQLAVSFFPVIN
jgi:hypothetical protein